MIREVVVPKRFQAKLERMTLGKGAHEKLIPIARDTVKKAVGVACKKWGLFKMVVVPMGFVMRTRVNGWSCY